MYEQGGVLEYWLLAPLRERAEFYDLEGTSGVETARYRLAHGGAEGRYHSSVVPGFWLQVAWLWQDPLPQTLDVLRELGLL